LIGDANPLFIGGIGHQFKNIKHQTAEGCGEQGSVSRLAQPWACPKQHNLMSIGASHNDREQALSSPISDNEWAAKGRCPRIPIGSAGWEPFAWWLAREGIGRNLRERYAVSEELPPSLITLVKKLDAVEGNRLSEELSPHSRTLLSKWDRERYNRCMSGRGFPSPWTVDEDHDACFIVRDANGQTLGYFCEGLQWTSRDFQSYCRRNLIGAKTDATAT
jgi:hypothetical protein